MRQEAVLRYQPVWREGERGGRKEGGMELYFYTQSQRKKWSVLGYTMVDWWRLRRKWCMPRSFCFPEGCTRPSSQFWCREQRWVWLIRTGRRSLQPFFVESCFVCRWKKSSGRKQLKHFPPYVLVKVNQVVTYDEFFQLKQTEKQSSDSFLPKCFRILDLISFSAHAELTADKLF